jgi:hypothetical protein
MRAITEEIEKIREVRKKISASFGHDPKKLVAYYQRLASTERNLGNPKQKTNFKGTEKTARQ